MFTIGNVSFILSKGNQKIHIIALYKMIIITVFLFSFLSFTFGPFLLLFHNMTKKAAITNEQASPSTTTIVHPGLSAQKQQEQAILVSINKKIIKK
jgi:hypothetical protein